MRRFRNIFVLVCGLLSLIAQACDRDAGSGETPMLATIADRVVTVKEFQQSFQIEPKWGVGLTRQEAMRNQLDYLIDVKLFALDAHREGLDQDEEVSRYLDFIAEKELNKALYHEVVENAIRISESEYEQGYLQLKKKVKLNYVFTRDRRRAKQFARQLARVSVDSLVLVPSLGEKKGTTGMLGFGEMMPEVEAFVFDMHPGAVHEPVPILGGYLVVQLANGSVEKFLSEMDFAQNKTRIRQVIYRRKAAPVANRFIKDLMLDKNLRLNPQVFSRLGDLFVQLEDGRRADQATLIPVYLSDTAVRSVQSEAREIQDLVLANYEGGEITVKAFLSKLRQMPAGFRPRIRMRRQLKDAIGVQVRNAFLAREARRRGLDRRRDIRHEIRRQQDHALASFYLGRRRAAVAVSQQEIRGLRTNSGLGQAVQWVGRALSDEQIRNIIIDRKMMAFKLQRSDELKKVFSVKVDSSVFRSLMPNPNDIIDKDPIPFVTRELYN